MLKPLAYWPYQSVRVLDVTNEHIYVKEECNNSLNAMHCFIQKGALEQNDTSSAIRKK